jgi:iron complex transport system ATP-binding protein
MLEVIDLNVSYGPIQVLKQISLQVSKGEIVGIIGPNGSGKTTLLKAIVKAIKPTSGTVLINEVDVHEIKTRQIAKMVAMVSQVISINFDFTVEDIVLMGRTPYIKGSESSKDIDIVRDAMKKKHIPFF